METQSAHCDWASDHVVAGIIDVLQVESGEDSPPYVCGVKSLEDFFGAIGQPAVTKNESQSSEREILLMGCPDTIRDEGHSRSVVSAMPRVPFRKGA